MSAATEAKLRRALQRYVSASHHERHAGELSWAVHVGRDTLRMGLEALSELPDSLADIDPGEGARQSVPTIEGKMAKASALSAAGFLDDRDALIAQRHALVEALRPFALGSPRFTACEAMNCTECDACRARAILAAVEGK